MYCTLYSKYCNILGVQKHEYFFRQFRNDLGLVYFVLLTQEIYFRTIFHDLKSISGLYFRTWILYLKYSSGLEIYIWTIFQDLKSISELLGDKKYFLGDDISTVDCVLFGHLTQFMYINIGFPQMVRNTYHCTNPFALKFFFAI